VCLVLINISYSWWFDTLVYWKIVLLATFALHTLQNRLNANALNNNRVGSKRRCTSRPIFYSTSWKNLVICIAMPIQLIPCWLTSRFDIYDDDDSNLKFDKLQVLRWRTTRLPVSGLAACKADHFVGYYVVDKISNLHCDFGSVIFELNTVVDSNEEINVWF
jgi:hypothetical protein